MLSLVAYAVLSTIYKGLTLPKELRGHEGVCGSCSYPATIGRTAICPECGSVYAEVGILTPSLSIRMRPSLGSVVVGWTFMVLLTLMGVSLPFALILESFDVHGLPRRLAGAGLMGIFVVLYAAGIVLIIKRRRRVFAPRAEKADRDGGTESEKTNRT